MNRFVAIFPTHVIFKYSSRIVPIIVVSIGISCSRTLRFIPMEKTEHLPKYDGGEMGSKISQIRVASFKGNPLFEKSI